MFERFTERARQVVVLAQQAARDFGHNYIGTEHLLLGLINEEEGLASRVLASFDVNAERVSAMISNTIGVKDEHHEQQIPFTPRAKKCLELALREALSLGHNYIGTEHVLLGVLREDDGFAARILSDLIPASEEKGNYAEQVHSEIVRLLSGTSAPKGADAPPRPARLTAQQHKRLTDRAERAESELADANMLLRDLGYYLMSDNRERVHDSQLDRIRKHLAGF